MPGPILTILPQLLLRWPALLAQLGRHAAQPRPSTALAGVKTIAHRGGWDTTPENSMPAFRNAARHSDMLELDVWLTKDGQVRRPRRH